MKRLDKTLMLLLVVPLFLGGCGGGNQAPSASIDSPENNGTLRELEVAFSGSGVDPEGKALTYAWAFGDGRSGTGKAVTHLYAKGGIYPVTLTVTDEGNQSATKTIDIKVNDPPKVVAVIQSDDSAGAAVKFFSGEAPLTLTFDGSSTSDSDGTIFSYAWDFDDDHEASEVTPQHTFERAGEYMVVLTVTDNMGAISRDTINVSVAEVALAPQTPDEEGVHTVRMVSDGAQNHFEPAILRIKPGDTVRWINDSGVHTSTSYSLDNQKNQGIPAAATGWDSGLLTEVGAVFELTFDEPGTYAYFCLPHEALGMVGVIVVDDGAPNLSQDFLNGLSSDAAREEFAKQIGIGTGGVFYTVEMNDDNVFSPAVLKVKPGDTIKWVNTGTFFHTVTAYHPDLYGKGLGVPEGAAGWHSDINGGKEWSYTIPEDAPAGTYAYFCLPHEALGMVGLLVVEAYTPLGEEFITPLPKSAQEALKNQMQEAANLE